MSEFWTPERVETTRRMWSGGSSASEIAEAIGATSRSAVIGKVHRLGIGRSPEAQKATADARQARVAIAERRKAAREREIRRKAEIRALEGRQARAEPYNHFTAVNATRKAKSPKGTDYAEPVAPVVDVSKAKPWTERRFGECAYPISGEGADTYSCCQPTEATYCRAHAAIMFIPLKEAPSRYARSLRRWAA